MFINTFHYSANMTIDIEQVKEKINNNNLLYRKSIVYYPSLGSDMAIAEKFKLINNNQPIM